MNGEIDKLLSVYGMTPASIGRRRSVREMIEEAGETTVRLPPESSSKYLDEMVQLAHEDQDEQDQDEQDQDEQDQDEQEPALTRGEDFTKKATDTKTRLMDLIDSHSDVVFRAICANATKNKGLYRERKYTVETELDKTKEIIRIAHRGVDEDGIKTAIDNNIRVKGLKQSSARLEVLMTESNTALEMFEVNPNITLRDTSPAGRQSHIQKLRLTVEDFYTFYIDSQPSIVYNLLRMVLAFFHNPLVIQDRFMNFLLLGKAGTGKTTIAKKISNVMKDSGILSLNATMIEGGKPDFVGQHLGETAPLTRNMLATCIGQVLFIDEAYSLCPLDTEGDGVDPYGLEFAAEFVRFLTEYKGLVCVVCGGYQSEMLVQFLASNEGMSRRFPYKLLLSDFTPQALVNVMKIQMSKHLDLFDDKGKREVFCNAVFTTDAENFMTIFFKKFVKTALLANQAGSASNLGENAALYFIQNVANEDFGADDCLTWVQKLWSTTREYGMTVKELKESLTDYMHIAMLDKYQEDAIKAFLNTPRDDVVNDEDKKKWQSMRMSLVNGGELERARSLSERLISGAIVERFTETLSSYLGENARSVTSITNLLTAINESPEDNKWRKQWIAAAEEIFQIGGEVDAGAFQRLITVTSRKDKWRDADKFRPKTGVIVKDMRNFIISNKSKD
jgi:SpoVK/Ycf46/Vps4 family AAA+-type ATPase